MSAACDIWSPFLGVISRSFPHTVCTDVRMSTPELAKTGLLVMLVKERNDSLEFAMADHSMPVASHPDDDHDIQYQHAEPFSVRLFISGLQL